MNTHATRIAAKFKISFKRFLCFITYVKKVFKEKIRSNQKTSHKRGEHVDFIINSGNFLGTGLYRECKYYYVSFQGSLSVS